MSRSLQTFECPFCRSSDVTFDHTTSTLICDRCGSKWLIGIPIENASSYPSVSVGTIEPETIVEAEKSVRYRFAVSPRFREELREIVLLRSEVDALRRTISEIKSDIAQMKQLAVETGVIELKGMTVEEAKPLVEDFLRYYMKTHEHVYPSDVADELGLKYELAREIFDILEKEGKLEKKAK